MTENNQSEENKAWKHREDNWYGEWLAEQRIRTERLANL